MKTTGCFRSFALLVLVLSPPTSLPASPLADSLYCGLEFDPEQLSAYGAAKRLGDLDVDDPPTVQLFYSLPEGRPFRPEVVQKLKDQILRVQGWFGEQMEAHGFGNITFRLETDDQGEPLVRGVPGTTVSQPGSSVSISVTVVDNGSTLIGNVWGVASWSSKHAGWVQVPSEFAWDTLAHELGHAFGMGHDFRDDTYIMSYGLDDRGVLSACSARFLAVNPHFNPDVGVEWAEAPVIELLSAPGYPEGSESVPIRLGLSDAHGLHLLRMRVLSRETHDARIGGGRELKLCRGFSGEEEAEVEIEYDGVVPSGAAWGFSDLSDPKVHPVSLTVIDRDGNRAGIGFDLWEVSRQHQATFELAEEVHSVAFVPGGTTLASGSGEGIELWDLETQAVTTTPLSGGATAVALSPDGATLASGSGREIQLLDMARGQVVATLSGHTHPIRSLAFSPDGTILASGAADAIRLWDLAARTSTASLPAGAASVAFSPDGATLASGSGEGVQLWDVATQTEVPTYRHSGAGGGQAVNTVAFSPDGTLVASGGDDTTVRLWNAASGAEVAVLEGHDRPVRAVAFSTDGTLLASGADLGVSLWDPVTKGRLAALQGYGRGINTLAFSADRTTLASGTGDGKVGLWDVSEWLQPRPRTLMEISGDDQRGTAGSALANPYVVEVRDQYDSLLQGLEVTFAVTEGDGTLSERYTLEKVTTGADGRAEALLTLGPDPGTNTVEVSIPGVELVTFSAVGVGTPSTPVMEDEFQRWHLPDGAIARLG